MITYYLIAAAAMVSSAPPAIEPKPVPTNNPGGWVTSNDYPARALQQERTGTSGFKLIVGTDGLVKQCTITSSSGSPDLDQTTCEAVTRRARFTPAKTKKGQAVEGIYLSRVRWEIPKEWTEGPQAGQVTHSYKVDISGRVTDCKILSNTSGRRFFTPCDRAETYSPYTDDTGTPIAVRIVSSQVVKVTPIPNTAN